MLKNLGVILLALSVNVYANNDVNNTNNKNEINGFKEIASGFSKYNKGLNVVENKNNDFFKQHEQEIKEKLKTYGKFYQKDRFWFVLEDPLSYPDEKNPEKSSIVLYNVYKCQDCLIADDALIGLENRIKSNISGYKVLKNVNTYRSPMAMTLKDNKPYIQDARIFFALKNLLPLDEFIKANNQLLFQINKNNFNITTSQDLNKFLYQIRVDEENFKKEYLSNEVENMSLLLAKEIDQMPLRTLPMVVINGKYIILSNGFTSNDPEYALNLIEYVATIAHLDKLGFITVQK